MVNAEDAVWGILLIIKAQQRCVLNFQLLSYK